jgi:hypothetical protein
MLRTRCRNSIMYNDTLWNYDTVCAPLHLAFGASEFFSVLDFAILAWVLIATQRASERPLAVRLQMVVPMASKAPRGLAYVRPCLESLLIIGGSY